MNVLYFKQRFTDKLLPVLVVTGISLLPTALLMGGSYLMLKPEKTVILQEEIPVTDTLKLHALPIDKNYMTIPLKG